MKTQASIIVRFILLSNLIYSMQPFVATCTAIEPGPKFSHPNFQKNPQEHPKGDSPEDINSANSDNSVNTVNSHDLHFSTPAENMAFLKKITPEKCPVGNIFKRGNPKIFHKKADNCLKELNEKGKLKLIYLEDKDDLKVIFPISLPNEIKSLKVAHVSTIKEATQTLSQLEKSSDSLIIAFSDYDLSNTDKDHTGIDFLSDPITQSLINKGRLVFIGYSTDQKSNDEFINGRSPIFRKRLESDSHLTSSQSLEFASTFSTTPPSGLRPAHHAFLKPTPKTVIGSYLQMICQDFQTLQNSQPSP